MVCGKLGQLSLQSLIGTNHELPERKNCSTRFNLRPKCAISEPNSRDQSCLPPELFRNIEMVTDLQKLIANVIS